MAHAVFDPLWKDGRFPTRTAAYAWLSKALGAYGEVHIGESDVKRCGEIIEACKALVAV